jgi:Fur family transcriptional regulator, ferric uptake regulator
MREELERLKQAGLRQTTPRVAILRALVLRSPGHPSVDVIAQTLLSEGIQLNLAEIYRVLKEFEESGVVLKHQFTDGITQYELNPGQSHDHMICVRCRCIFEFQSAEIQHAQHTMVTADGHQLIDRKHVLYILCAGCRKG